jgi:hypothetical protein
VPDTALDQSRAAEQIGRTWLAPPLSSRRASETRRAGHLLRAEVVAQTIACLDFLYICDKVTILG